jgi:mannan endo-1,4-beta-mannosidase
MTWQLANEPQNAVMPDEYLGEYSLELPPAPSDSLFGWIESTSAYIKAAAPNQLVNVGFEGKQGKWYYQKAHNFSTIDYGTTHCWVENWGIYSQLNDSQANLEAAKTFARGFIANSSQWAAEIGKPIFLEEFGMARNNWENAGKEYQYLSSAGTSNKDEYFEVSLPRPSLTPHPPLTVLRADYHWSSNGQVQRSRGSLCRNLSVGVWWNLPSRDSTCQ